MYAEDKHRNILTGPTSKDTHYDRSKCNRHGIRQTVILVNKRESDYGVKKSQSLLFSYEKKWWDNNHLTYVYTVNIIIQYSLATHCVIWIQVDIMSPVGIVTTLCSCTIIHISLSSTSDEMSLLLNR